MRASQCCSLGPSFCHVYMYSLLRVCVAVSILSAIVPLVCTCTCVYRQLRCSELLPSSFSIRSYVVENARSHQNSEAKPLSAVLVLRRGTTREPAVMNAFFWLLLVCVSGSIPYYSSLSVGCLLTFPPLNVCLLLTCQLSVCVMISYELPLLLTK